MTGSANFLLLGTVSELEELTTKNGRPWIKLLVEVKSWRRAGDGEAGQEESTFIPVNCFSKLAETARAFLKFGDAVGLTCRVSGTQFKSGDGKVKRGISLTADQLHLIPNGQRSGSCTPNKSAAATHQRPWRSQPGNPDATLNSLGEPSDLTF